MSRNITYSETVLQAMNNHYLYNNNIKIIKKKENDLYYLYTIKKDKNSKMQFIAVSIELDFIPSQYNI